MQPSRRRFTFIELIVALLVIAILGAAVLSWLAGRDASRERALRDQFKLMLEDARQLAVARQRDVCVLVGATQARAVYTADGACSPALPVVEVHGSERYVMQLPGGVLAGSSGKLRFDARGLPVPDVDRQASIGKPGLRISRETGRVQ